MTILSINTPAYSYLNKKQRLYYFAYDSLPLGLPISSINIGDISFFWNYFLEVDDWATYYRGVIGVLWLRVRLGEVVDQSTIIEEYGECIGIELFSQKMASHPEEFAELVQRLLKLLKQTEKIYYSGFQGWLNSRRDKKYRKKLQKHSGYDASVLNGPLCKRLS